jgi:hypothetical protein
VIKVFLIVDSSSESSDKIAWHSLVRGADDASWFVEFQSDRHVVASAAAAKQHMHNRVGRYRLGIIDRLDSTRYHHIIDTDSALLFDRGHPLRSQSFAIQKENAMTY